MADVVTRNVLRHVQSLARMQTERRQADGALLRAFAAGNDQAAFTTLVCRHGPMVLGVCRRVLHHLQDAEDAFQATFVLLARNARSIRKRQSLPSWLHGVAYRTACNARRAAFRRRKYEAEVTPMRETNPECDLAWREVQVLLDEEVQRLPDTYRTAFILCCLQEKSGAEAAALLDVKETTLRTRVARARALLREAFSRRGVSLAAALATASLADGAARAAVPGSLLASTVQAATSAGASVLSANVAALVQGGKTVIPLLSKRTAALGVLALAVLGAGIALSAYPQSPPPGAGAASRTAPEGPARQAEPTEEKPDATRTEVRGRVLDQAGKPFKGAKLYLGYISSHGWGFHRKDWSGRGTDGDLPLSEAPWPLPVRATSGEDGMFRFTFARSDVDQRLVEDQAALPAVIAVAEGKGPAWAPVGKSGARLTLRLVADDVPIDGRIIDEDGKAVRGAKVHVVCLAELGANPSRWAGPVPGQPRAVTTGADGRFRLTGLGNKRKVILGLEGATIEHRQISARTEKPKAGETTAGKHHDLPATFTYLAAAGRRVHGVVRDKATGKPVSGVRVKAWDGFVEVFTDKEGRYELTGCAKAPRSRGMNPYTLTAQPPAGQPYFSAVASSKDTPGLGPVTLDFDLVGGIVLRGKVKEKGTGLAPAVAVVEYHPLFPNTHTRKIVPYEKPASSAVVGRDGSFGLVVLPGPGALCVSAGPRDAYALGLATRKAQAKLFEDEKYASDDDHLNIAFDQSQGRILQERYNAFELINPGEKETALTRDVELLPARTVAGTVAGPDGKPLAGATVTGINSSLESAERLEGASFLVKRLNPARARNLLFRYEEKNLAALVTVRGDEKEPLVVRLAPCGSVTGRLLGKDNKPAAGIDVRLGRKGWVAGEGRTQSDREGRFRMEGLIVGDCYYVMAFLGSTGWQQEFTATVKGNDLGDLKLVREAD
jgi:RNA polymerase sigma factor (sigma-70 family)